MNSKVITAIFLGFLVSGCTTFPVDDAVVRADSIDVAGSPAQHALAVDEIRSAENININEIFEKALKQSLANQGILTGPKVANFRLLVSIEHWDTPGLTDISFDRISTMTARYTLVGTESDVPEWSKTVTTKFNAPKVWTTRSVKFKAGSEQDRKLGYPQPGTPIGASNEQRIEIANAGAARTNIARFIEAFSVYMESRL